MRAWVIVVILVAFGIVVGWVGYWVGHALGWTTDAEFPLTIGGGARAIGLSILFSFASVMLGAWWFIARPLLRIRRLSASGMLAHATIRRMWRTGVFANTGGKQRHQLAFELEMHPDGGRDYEASALGMLTQDEEAPLRPGEEVTVRYDPAHPASVAVVGPVVKPVG